MTFDSKTVTRMAAVGVALLLGVAGACYDLTPVPVSVSPTDAGSSCTDDAADACSSPDADALDAGADDAEANMDQQNEAPQ